MTPFKKLLLAGLLVATMVPVSYTHLHLLRDNMYIISFIYF